MINVDYLALSAAAQLQEDLQKGKPATYMGQKVLFSTRLFGKDYYWMQDVDGVIYLAHQDEHGLPDFS